MLGSMLGCSHIIQWLLARSFLCWILVRFASCDTAVYYVRPCRNTVAMSFNDVPVAGHYQRKLARRLSVCSTALQRWPRGGRGGTGSSWEGRQKQHQYYTSSGGGSITRTHQWRRAGRTVSGGRRLRQQEALRRDLVGSHGARALHLLDERRGGHRLRIDVLDDPLQPDPLPPYGVP